MQESIYSKRLQCGGKTYFFDVRKTKSGDKYLQITESRLKEDGERLKGNIVVFNEHLGGFIKTLVEIMEKGR